MPRINYIAPPISFNDRGSEIAEPIMQNAMQLASIYATEVPRIRMQKEAAAEEKQRYGAAQAKDDLRYNAAQERDKSRYADSQRRSRESLLMSRVGSIQNLLTPDGVDLDGDGNPDLQGSLGSKGQVVQPRMGAVRAPAAGPSPEAAADAGYSKLLATYQKARAAAVAKLTHRNADGESVLPEDAQIDEYLQRAGVRMPDEPQADDTSSDVLGSPANYGMEGGDGAGQAAPGAGASLGRMSTGSPVHSAARREYALRELNNIRMQIQAHEREFPGSRAQMGLPSDEDIEALKMQLAAPAAPTTSADGTAPPADDGAAPGDQSQGAPLAEEPAPASPAAAPANPAAPVAPPPEHVTASLSKVTEVVAALREAISANINVRKNLQTLMAISSKVPMEHRASVGLDAPLSVPNQGVGELRDQRRDTPVQPGPAEDDLYWDTPQGRRASQIRLTMSPQASGLPRDYNW